MSGENWYIRLGGWDNLIYARLLNWLAAGTSMLAALCRGKTSTKIEGAARLLRNLALSIARPEAARLMASPQLLKKALIETVGFTSLITKRAGSVCQNALSRQANATALGRAGVSRIRG
jgi:hypothetical protein